MKYLKHRITYRTIVGCYCQYTGMVNLTVNLMRLRITVVISVDLF